MYVAINVATHEAIKMNALIAMVCEISTGFEFGIGSGILDNKRRTPRAIRYPRGSPLF